MTIQDMVYGFRLKGDAIDSKNMANIRIPAIIYLLNEGMLSLIKKRYSGSNSTLRKSFEEVEKRREEFQKLLVTDEYVRAKKLETGLYTVDITACKRPYMFLARANFIADRPGCDPKRVKGILVQTDDLDISEFSPLEQSSFEWGEVNYRIAEDKLKVITDKDMTISKARIDYLRYPEQVDMRGYKHFDKSDSKDVHCELPVFMHPDVVDEAGLIYAGSFNNADLQAKLLKLANNE